MDINSIIKTLKQHSESSTDEGGKKIYNSILNLVENISSVSGGSKFLNLDEVEKNNSSNKATISNLHSIRTHLESERVRLCNLYNQECTQNNIFQKRINELEEENASLYLAKSALECKHFDISNENKKLQEENASLHLANSALECKQFENKMLKFENKELHIRLIWNDFCEKIMKSKGSNADIFDFEYKGFKYTMIKGISNEFALEKKFKFLEFMEDFHDKIIKFMETDKWDE